MKETEEIKRGPFLILEVEFALFLRYIGSGSFMKVSGDLCHTSDFTAWKSIHKIISKLCKLRERIISFPRESEFERVSLSFKEKQGFPGVIGCVDGSQFEVFVPNSDIRETYRNRKGFFR